MIIHIADKTMEPEQKDNRPIPHTFKFNIKWKDKRDEEDNKNIEALMNIFDTILERYEREKKINKVESITITRD